MATDFFGNEIATDASGQPGGFIWFAPPVTTTTDTTTTTTTTQPVTTTSTLITNAGAVVQPTTYIPYEADYAKLASNLKTPQDIVSYMQSNFTYGFHYGFVAYKPQDLNSGRVGDCKDFATFFSSLAGQLGYDVSEYALYYNKAASAGHVISTIAIDGAGYYQSNFHLVGPIGGLDAIGQSLISIHDIPQSSVVGGWVQYPAGYEGRLVFAS
jgi:transglutaminase-like putative cysteine protease